MTTADTRKFTLDTFTDPVKGIVYQLEHYRLQDTFVIRKASEEIANYKSRDEAQGAWNDYKAHYGLQLIETKEVQEKVYSLYHQRDEDYWQIYNNSKGESSFEYGNEEAARAGWDSLEETDAPTKYVVLGAK